jgi:uncharacterized protein (TIGR03435 family)
MGGRNVTIQSIVECFPTLDLGRPVIDSTGLKGHFDFTLDWAPNRRDTDPSGPDFFEALKQQMGLKLSPQKGTLEILVLDHLERPSEN